jgi:hypothetical protein
VLFSCKNGEHRSLPNVYYLPRLTANIISVGQLDEGGYQVLVEDGVMRTATRSGICSRRFPAIQEGCTCSTSPSHARSA